MNHSDLPTTSTAHLEAVNRAVTDDSFAKASDETVLVRNFAFSGAMLPGWTFARPRAIDTGSGVRLIQVNAQAEDGGERAVRIETMEAADAERGRALFMEALTRFQNDPASILCTPPEIGEAEACIGDDIVVFLRGNLVITIARIGKGQIPVDDLAKHLDSVITERPEAVEESDTAPADLASGRPMIKSFLQTGGSARKTPETFAIAADGSARRLPDAAAGDGENDG